MQPGTILAGRYRAGRQLGAGGMGVIVEGTHLELGTPVAIKVLHERLASDPERVERFLREARAAAQLRGEHVCRVHDCGTLPGGEPFMVMELLTGCDLSALVDQLGPLPPETVIAYALQACAGVAEAHALGIVHRDIKPTNIFRTHRPDGAPLIKILDFGLAKPMNGQDLSLTQTAAVMGSPRYMSPEQLKSSKTTDPRSDIWALGVVMYELLVGEPPFKGESITELALNINGEPVPPMPSVPPALAAIVNRCLEKSVTKRYQSAAELAAALEGALDEAKHHRTRNDTLVETGPKLDAVLGDLTETAPSKVQPAKPTPVPVVEAADVEPERRSPLPMVLLGVAVLLAGGLGAYFMTRKDPRPVPPPSAAMPAITIDAGSVVETPDAAVAAQPPDAAVAEPVVEKPASPPPKKRVRTQTKTDLTKSRY